MQNKLKVFLILFLLHFISVCAQHCPFDNQGLLVLNIKQKPLAKPDSLLPVLVYELNNDNVFRQFKKNPKETGSIVNVDIYDATLRHFDFAKSNYIASIPINAIETGKIYIINFQKSQILKTINLTKDMVYDLHENFGNTWGEFSGTFTPKPLYAFNHEIVFSLE